MSGHARDNIYYPSKAVFTPAINKPFDVMLREVVGSIVSCMTGNFQILRAASSSRIGIF